MQVAESRRDHQSVAVQAPDVTRQIAGLRDPAVQNRQVTDGVAASRGIHDPHAR